VEHQLNDTATKLLTFEITGFRSLRDFNISITPGLNIITGRNGSGKTNFIEFLDFLSIFTSEDLGAAVSKLGGTSRIFSQESLKSKVPRVSVKVTDTAKLPTDGAPFGITDHDPPLFNFEYFLELRMIKKAAIVFVSKESISLFPTYFEGYPDPKKRIVGRIEIARKFDPVKKRIETKTKVGPRLLSSSSKNPMRYVMTPRLRRQPRRIKPSEERAKILDERIISNLEETESMLSRTYSFQAIHSISRMLSASRSFNLLPSKIRIPSNITDEPEITPDGSGLTAVLYHMRRAKDLGEDDENYMYGFDPYMLSKVESWTNFLLPELRGISANADLSTGKYVASLEIVTFDNESTLRVPFQSASDGTLKWLTLACKLAQSPRFFSIEEPENFLHPQMQSFFVQMLREIGSDEAGGLSFVLLSTHSETIINNCDPSELVLFEFNDQRTSCRRIQNMDRLVEQMNKSGFGLGHFYVANAVS